jgi:flagellar biosynthesis protein FliP
MQIHPQEHRSDAKGEVTLHSKRICLALLIGLILLDAGAAWAAASPLPNISLNIGGSADQSKASTVVQLLFVLTILSLAPAILLMLTSFTRIAVVLSLVRHALGTTQMPPNQIIIGLALFLTFFVMAPVWQKVNEEALKPYYEDRITGEEAFDLAAEPIKSFMLKQTREKDLALFVNIAKEKRPEKTVGHFPAGADPGIRHQRAEDGIPDRFFDLSPFLHHRYRGVEHPSVHGHDDAPTDYDQPPLQAPALCACGRLEPDCRIAGSELLGTGRGGNNHEFGSYCRHNGRNCTAHPSDIGTRASRRTGGRGRDQPLSGGHPGAGNDAGLRTQDRRLYGHPGGGTAVDDQPSAHLYPEPL